MIGDDGSAIQNEGGVGVADHILEESETCLMKTAKIDESMACLVIVLNVLLAPIGTFLAAGLDKRGLNKPLLLIGALYLILFILV